MKVSRDDAVAVFKKLDFKTADKWSPKRITDKIKTLPEITDDDTDLDDDDLNSLLDELLDAITAQEEIELEGGEEPAPKTKTKAKAAPKAKAKAKAAPKAKAKAKAAVKSASGNGKPGIIASIVEFLTAATDKKPLSKEQLVKKLSARFKDRDPEAMAKTVMAQVPRRLVSEKALKVKENEKGYYISS